MKQSKGLEMAVRGVHWSRRCSLCGPIFGHLEEKKRQMGDKDVNGNWQHQQTCEVSYRMEFTPWRGLEFHDSPLCDNVIGFCVPSSNEAYGQRRCKRQHILACTYFLFCFDYKATYTPWYIDTIHMTWMGVHVYVYTELRTRIYLFVWMLYSCGPVDVWTYFSF